MGNNRAMSVVELVIVMGIVAIGAGISCLKVSELLIARDLKRVSYDLVGALDHYSERAFYFGEDVGVWVKDSGDGLRAARFSGGEEVPLAGHSIESFSVVSIDGKFAQLEQGESHVLTLRKDGSATPGRFVLTAKNADTCSIIQALRGARRIECTIK
ncbi:MAG: hypothetical protein IT291_00200 [Deltaproteobacteria bacterium]|nr:hypothetical protein [Deltaproteobacteria bacterium]